MSQFVSPGVFSLERDFSDYVAALGTTSVGLVGTARRGRLNVPQFLSSPESCVRIYEAPSASHYGVYVAINYLREGNQLWFQRVAREFEVVTTVDGDNDKGQNILNVTSAAALSVNMYIRITQDGKLTTVAKITAKDTNELTLDTDLADNYTVGADVGYSTVAAAAKAEVMAAAMLADTSTAGAVVLRADSEGSWANYGSKQGVEIIIEDGGNTTNVDPVTGLAFENTDGIPLEGLFPNKPSLDTVHDLLALSSDLAVGQTRGVNDSRRAYRVTAITKTSNDIELSIVDANDFFTIGDNIQVRGSTSGNNGTFEVTAVDGDGVTYVNAGGATVASPTGVTATNLESSATALVWRCTNVNGTWAPIGVHTKRVRVFYQGRQVEVFDGLIGYDEDADNYWNTVLESSGYIKGEYIGNDGVQPTNTYNRVNYPSNPRLLFAVGYTFGTETFDAIRGNDGADVTAADYIGTVRVDGTHSGLQAFRRVEQYDLNLVAVPGVSDAGVVQELISVVEDRSDSLAVIDPPMGMTPQEVVDWHNGAGYYAGVHSAFVSNRAALYYPWVKQSDPYTGRDIWLPPSAVALPVFAYSDRVGEQWFAAAGYQRGQARNVIAVEYAVSQGDRDLMYGPGNGNGVNPIAVFPRDGIMVYGNRTLQRTPSALDRINVRRLYLYAAKAVASASRRLQFEQNDEVLWGQLKAAVEPFFKGLLGRRAFEYVEVICGPSNNPPEQRNQGEVNLRTVSIPTKSAERIVNEYVILPSGANVSEIVQSLSNSSNTQ